MARMFVFIVCLFSYNGCALAAASGRPADLSKKQAQRAQLIGQLHYMVGYFHLASSSAGMVSGSCPRTVRVR